MANVFVEPRPKSRDAGAAITGYVVESAGDDVLSGPYPTQAAAIAWAKKAGHNPLVARVRHLTDKNKPDHWRTG
jgi:hypothetical protein